MKVLLNIAKYISAVAVIGGAALWFDAQFDKNAESLKDIQQTVDYINTEQSFMAEDLQGIHDTLENMEDMQEAQSKKLESVVWGLKHINQFTPEQFEEILNEMLKKNNEPITLPIVLSAGEETGSIP